MWITMSLVITSLIIYALYQPKKSPNEIDPAVYLWSKRVFDLNDYNLLGTEHISTQNDIAQQIRLQNKVLWIRNTSSNSNTLTDLDHLGALLHLIEEPVILVTSDGDRDVPSSYNPELVKTLLSSSKIIKWHTQNYDKSIIDPKLTHYPIGLDMHSSIFMAPKTLKILDKIKSDAELRAQKFNYYLVARDKHQGSKKNKIFCDSHLSKTHPRRQQMFEILKHNSLIDFQNQRVHYTDILEKYAQYRFILSKVDPKYWTDWQQK